MARVLFALLVLTVAVKGSYVSFWTWSWNVLAQIDRVVTPPRSVVPDATD